MTAMVAAAAAAVARSLLCNSVSCFTWKLMSWPRAVAITAVAVVARRTHAVRAPPLWRARVTHTHQYYYIVYLSKLRFYDEYGASMVVMTCAFYDFASELAGHASAGRISSLSGSQSIEMLVICVDALNFARPGTLGVCIRRQNDFFPCTVVLNF